MTDNPPFPQYAVSRNPEVVEAVKEVYKQYDEFRQRCREWSETVTGNPDLAMLNGFVLDYVRFAGLSVAGLNEMDPKPELPGDWKKPSGGTLAPYKKNALVPRMPYFKAPDIPGRPRIAWGRDYVGGGACFVHDDAAWSGYGFIPAIGEHDGAWVGLWDEIKASEFYNAREAKNTREVGNVG